MRVERANTHFCRYVAVNSVPTIAMDNASRTGELSLNNPHASEVVFDSRLSLGETGKRCRIEPHHSRPTTKVNNHADRVSLNQYASRSHVTESENSGRCPILQHPAHNQCRGKCINADGVRLAPNRVPQERAMRTLLAVDRILIDSTQSVDGHAGD